MNVLFALFHVSIETLRRKLQWFMTDRSGIQTGSFSFLTLARLRQLTIPFLLGAFIFNLPFNITSPRSDL